jgi:hypothetical protein
MQAMPMEDPRDNLEKATRDQLWAYAKSVGVAEVREPMPKLLCEQILRAKGFTNIPVDVTPLGSPSVRAGPPKLIETQPVAAIDAMTDLRRQYEQQQANPDPVPVPEELNFVQLRSELKRRGIKFARSDNFETLKAKLNGENAA